MEIEIHGKNPSWRAMLDSIIICNCCLLFAVVLKVIVVFFFFPLFEWKQGYCHLKISIALFPLFVVVAKPLSTLLWGILNFCGFPFWFLSFHFRLKSSDSLMSFISVKTVSFVKVLLSLFCNVVSSFCRQFSIYIVSCDYCLLFWFLL